MRALGCSFHLSWPEWGWFVQLWTRDCGQLRYRLSEGGPELVLPVPARMGHLGSAHGSGLRRRRGPVISWMLTLSHCVVFRLRMRAGRKKKKRKQVDTKGRQKLELGVRVGYFASKPTVHNSFFFKKGKAAL